MSAKIEIFKNGVWTKLKLSDSSSVRYNARINKIGKTSNRQIGSTNTFSLPYTSHNLKALSINTYNAYTLATSLNTKYIANYFVDDKLIRTGFLLINNTRDGNINVNFMDEALDVVSKWGAITYKELLEDRSLPISSDYASAILELSDYSMPTTTLLPYLSTIGSRGYNLCLFPNNLNAIGSEFQQSSAGIRIADSFNPYQSRPIFSARSLFDLACERYGYTGIFDNSVNWNTVEDTYFISEGSDKNDETTSGLGSITHPSIASYQSFWRQNFNTNNNRYGNLMKFPVSTSIQPNNIPNWLDSDGVYTDALANGGTRKFKSTGYWRSDNTVYTPNLNYGTGGTIRFTGITNLPTTSEAPTTRVVVYWYPAIEGDPIVSLYYGDRSGDPALPATITLGTDFVVDVTIDKTFFSSVNPTLTPIGVSIINDEVALHSVNGTEVPLMNMQVTETYSTEDSMTFDQYGQFENTSVDFTYAASRKTLQSLLISIMHKEGILMNINDNDKTIKFFTYDHYTTQVSTGDVQNWDDYFLEYNKLEWQTNYGNDYGRLNEIGLSDAFKGNTFLYELDNQGELSRYKAKGKDINKNFKDVEDVDDILNTGNKAYTEYTSKGLGLVEFRGQLTGTLDQIRATSATSLGTLSNMPLIANVNYSTIPDGVSAWYKLIDSAVRVKAQFLLPVEEISNLDLSKPIYVAKLGGYYIIEEVSEYRGSTTATTVQLIKLITEFPRIYGPELFVNGTFDTDLSGWTAEQAIWVSTSGGAAELDRALVANCRINQSVMTSGVTYKFTYDMISNTGAFSVRIYRGATFEIISSDVGSHEVTFTADGSIFIFDSNYNGSTIVIDNLSLKEVIQ